jgi:hypothetical protein
MAQLQQATADFNKHMKNGQVALQNKKYPAAVKKFQAALAIRPGDKEATALLEQAKAQQRSNKSGRQMHGCTGHRAACW